MRKALPWLVGAGLAAAAVAITAATPAPETLYTAFPIAGSFAPDADPRPVTSRTLTAVVVDAAFTERVQADQWHADGNWLVVTVAASAPRSEEDSVIALASLHVGGEVFHASERPRDPLLGERLRIGIDTVGMLAFELPADVRAGDAELRLTSEPITPRLDDVITVGLRLDDIRTVPSIDVEPPEVGP